MFTTPKTIGAISSAFILYVGLSYVYAAHPQAAPDQSEDRGSQGNQDKIKGDTTPKRGQDEIVDEGKVKEDKRAREEFEKRNAKGQGQDEMNRQMPPRTLQNK